MRRTNYSNIGVRDDTKKELNELRDRLKEKYPDVTYDELLNIFLKKNQKITLTDAEIKRIIAQCRGVL